MFITVDTDRDGVRDTDGSDKQIAYRYRSTNYDIYFYPNYTDNPLTYYVLTSKRIRPAFDNDMGQETYWVYSAASNYLEIKVTGRWDPTSAVSRRIGSLDHP